MANLIGYQIHRHSHTCKKKLKRRRKCRFSFPRPPMEETRILKPLPANLSITEKKSAENLYGKIEEKLNEMGRNFKEDIDYDIFLESLETTHVDYIFAIRSTIKRPTVFLRRSTNAIFINAYNRKLLEAWRANIDIQFVLDTYACAKYCVGYILKSEGGVSGLLQAVAKDVRHGNLTIQEKFRKIGNVLINGSEISSQEAAAFLLGIPNTNCSRQDIYINTTRPEERIRVLKTKVELDELDDDDEDVCAKGIIDHYTQRPVDLESTCLADFASMYEFMKTKKMSQRSTRLSEPDEQTGNENCDIEAAISTKINERTNSLILLDSSGTLRKRRVRKIIRFRHYGKLEDPSNYYREQLMLFLPWRNEETELLTIDSAQKANTHQEEIRKNLKYFYWDYNVDDQYLNHILQDIEDANAEENQEDSYLQGKNLAGENEYFETNDLDEIKPGETRVRRFLKPRMVDEQQYLDLMRKLNDFQRRFVLNTMFNLKTCKTPFYNFLSGGAGVGKSYALTAIVQSFLRYNSKFPSHHPEQMCVLVSAPTGKAAFNVFGMTLHCTFRLPPTQYRGKVGDLDDSTLNTLRIRLEGVKLFIIDEISMVSVVQLYDIDQRLRQIFATNLDFGGKSIIVMGHLRQLPPVAASHAFTNPSHIPRGDCVGNYLWSHFMLLELTEIMRQRGDFEFCKALNNMSEGCMDADDIALIRSREVNVDNRPPDEAIRLFKTNHECEIYNSEVHKRLNTEGCLSIAKDRIQGSCSIEQTETILNYARSLNTQQSEGLPYQTQLQVGGEYFVSTNVDVQDGLFNGSTGTLKLIEYEPKKVDKIPQRIWMDFHNFLIGLNKRNSTKSYQERKNIYVDWVSVEKEKRILSAAGPHRGIQVIREQIPVVAANGMTINKSQGSSLPLVVVSVRPYEEFCQQPVTTKKRKRKWLSRELLYVACSRSTSLQGLFVQGNFEPPLPPAADDPVSVEMERLRETPFPFEIKFLQDYGDNFQKIYFHNVQSFNAHEKDVISDQCAMASDIIALVEPWLLASDVIHIPSYRCVHRTNCRGRIRNSEGALIMEKDRVAISFNSSIYVDILSCGHFLLHYSLISGINVIMVYKSPEYPKSTFLNKLASKLNELTGKILIFGDVNINLQTKDGQSFLKLLYNKNLISKLPIDCPSTDYGTTIDFCFSNVLEIEAWFYESYYSYHKPICMVWPKTFDTT